MGLKSKSNTTTYKVYTNGGNVGFRVGIIRKAEQQTRLSDTGVSDQEQFEEVIAAMVMDEEQRAKKVSKQRKKRNVAQRKKRLLRTTSRSLLLSLTNTVKSLAKTFNVYSMLPSLW